MITLLAHFPGGRYHATPWGHHVNEGLVEWPPSPWRLVRALLATGYTHLGWRDVPDTGRELIERLACVLPVYKLPALSLAHSRHYMPLGKLKDGVEETTLVIDTWGHVGAGVMAVSWDVVLSGRARELLGHLAGELGYLGRSESWAEARILGPTEALPEGFDAVPVTPGSNPGPGWEQVPLLAPESNETYVAWRAQALEKALGAFEIAPGERVPRGVARKRERTCETYPTDLLACLHCETSWLKKQGWSHPPGARPVFYWRSKDVMRLSEVRRSACCRPRVDSALLAITTNAGTRGALPPLSRTLPQAELVHRALVGLVNRLGEPDSASELVGRDEKRQPLEGHRHAHVLPLDLDGDGRLDHVLLWAPAGLGPLAQDAIARLRQTYTKGGGDPLRLALAACGTLSTLLNVRAPLDRPLARLLGGHEGAKRWGSATPFVPPRYLKKSGCNTLEGQILAELESRGLPPARVTAMSAQESMHLGLRHYVRVRRHGPAPKIDTGRGVHLEFERPVRGPICLGYASHYGLGRFASDD